MRRLQLSSVAALLGLCVPEPLQKQDFDGFIPTPSKPKNSFPQGRIMRFTPKYKNPAGNHIKNKKQAAQMNAMHDAWYENKFGAKPAPY